MAGQGREDGSLSLCNGILFWSNNVTPQGIFEGNRITHKERCTASLLPQKLVKTVNGTTTEYFLNGSQILAQKTDNNTIWFFYDSEGNRIGMISGGYTFYYLYNLQGDVIGLMDARNGRIIATYTYDAWGNCHVENATNWTAGNSNPFRYRGYYYDTESGLYYLNSRYYSPELGRFINADVFVSTDVGGVLSANMFAYCENNPVNMVDEYGRDARTVAAEWGVLMRWLPFIDGPIPVGDAIYGLGFLVLGLICLNETDKKLPNQGPVSEIPDAPEVDAGKQGKHVPGHPNNDKSKSQWGEGETGVRETQEAWANGRVVKPDGSVRVGTASDGRQVKVHQGKSGKIHGYPVRFEK